MAFSSAVGHGNLQRGNAFPVIYSQMIQSFFRTTSVVNEITNTDYTGEIADKGDTVRIMKEPLVTTGTYNRGTEIDIQDLDDEDLTLVIDKGLYTAFQVDDVEKRLSHIEWGSTGQTSAAYALSDQFDTEVLQYMHDNSTTNSTFGVGTTGSTVSIGYGTGNAFTPLDLIVRFARLMDENDVPDADRWFLASPAFYEQLGREDGKFIDASVTGDPESPIRNRNLINGGRMVHGFKLYKSTNNPTSSNDDVTVLAGGISSTATARAMNKSEIVRREKTFADLYRGLMVYGRKVLRPEALFSGFITLGDA